MRVDATGPEPVSAELCKKISRSHLHGRSVEDFIDLLANLTAMVLMQIPAEYRGAILMQMGQTVGQAIERNTRPVH